MALLERYSGKISPSDALWDTYECQLIGCKNMALSFNDEFVKSTKSVHDVYLEIGKITARLRQIWSKKLEYNIPEDQINLTPNLYIKCLEDIIQISDKINVNLRHINRLKVNVNETLQRIGDLFAELLDGMTMQEIENVTIPNFDWAKNNFHPSLFEIPEIQELRERVIGIVEDDERKIKEFKMDQSAWGLASYS